jgi:SAM-dependent methyltransferase
MGTYDLHMAELETAAVRRWIQPQQFREGNHGRVSGTIRTVLDVGSGSGYWARRMFEGFDCTRCTEYEGVAERRADIRALPFPDSSFSVVHARRVVSNLPPAERAGAIAELCRVARRAVLLVDVFKEPHDRVQALRESLGLPRLPKGIGAGPLDLELLPHDRAVIPGDTGPRVPGQIQSWAPIGASYYLWTRCFLARAQAAGGLSGTVPWDHPARTLYPEYHDAAKYAVHRMYVIKP